MSPKHAFAFEAVEEMPTIPIHSDDENAQPLAGLFNLKSAQSIE